MKRSLLIALSALGVSISAGTASAQDDVSVILANVPNTVSVLADGLATTADTFNTTGSFEATNTSLFNNGVTQPGIALLDGAPTVGALVPVIDFEVSPIREVGDLVGRILDDPSVEGFQQNVLGPNDLNTLVARNIPTFADTVYRGVPGGIFTGTPGGIGDELDILLQGNAFTPPGSTEPLLLHILFGVGQGNYTNIYRGLLDDTAIEGVDPNGANVELALAIALTAAQQAAGLGNGVSGGSGTDIYSLPDTLAQEQLGEIIAPAASQSLLGQSTLAEVAANLETEPTIDALGYYDLVGAAGFSQ